MLALKRMCVLKVNQIVSIIFQLASQLKNKQTNKTLGTYFTLSLILVQSFSLQTQLDVSLYLLLAYSGLCHTIMLKLV